jgi:hypothetical protein
VPTDAATLPLLASRLQVKILRPESYWFNQTGKVVSVDQVGARGLTGGGSAGGREAEICAATAFGSRRLASSQGAERSTHTLNTPCRSRPLQPHPPPTPRPAPQSGIKYPVVVRFEAQNYAGVTTNNFALDEVEPAK